MGSLSAQPLVLVADDDIVMRSLLVSVLQRDGCDVVTASDGREVVRLAGDGRFDALVIDVLMPGTNGLQATRELRTQPHPLALPIILISGTDDPWLRTQAHSVGVNAFIAKPFSPTALAASVRGLLRRPRVDPQLRSTPAVCPWPAPSAAGQRADRHTLRTA